MPGVLDPEKYEIDEDGLVRAIVGEWVYDKHARLKAYVGISGRSVRTCFIGQQNAGATYIDLFSGPGRARIRDTREVVDGSALVAWKQAAADDCPFSKIYIADAEPELASACAARLSMAGASAHVETGPAETTVDKIVSRLHPDGLHLAFLDPFNLGSLSFKIIAKLSTLRRMDILIHISAMDLQMNARSYIDREAWQLDAFAPGWRDFVEARSADDTKVRAQILECWRTRVKELGMSTAETMQLISGPNNERLYWLAFAARHERALEFWEKIRDARPNRQLRLL